MSASTDHVAEVTGTYTGIQGEMRDTIRVRRACGHIEVSSAPHGEWLPNVAVTMLCWDCQEQTWARKRRLQTREAVPCDLIAQAAETLRSMQPDPRIDRALRLLKRALASLGDNK